MNCPNCGLINPSRSQRCDCGWNFESRRLEAPPATASGLAKHQRRIRSLSLLALVLILGPFLWVLREGREGFAANPGVVRPAAAGLVPALCLILPFLVASCLVLVQLRGAASARALASAASMSATLGVYTPIISVLGLSARPPLWGRPWLWDSSFLMLMVTYWVLYWSTRQAFRAGWPQGARGCLPALSLSVGCLLTGSLFLFWNLGSWPRQYANEAATEAVLRTIGKAVVTYARNGNCGYPETLAALPATASANADEAELTARFRQGPVFLKNSYRLEYGPGPRVTNTAAGCPPGVANYVMTARPLTWGVDGRCSFSMDDSGAIHYTTENRPATLNDPADTR